MLARFLSHTAHAKGTRLLSAAIVFAMLAGCGAGESEIPTGSSGVPTSAEPAPSASEAGPADGDIAEFYSGATIRIIVGSGPGGGFDTFARAVARHIPAYIPGEPTVIVENIGGSAGQLIAANSVYTTLPQDGTQIATFSESLVLTQLFEDPAVGYDVTAFNWLGSSAKETDVCIARTDTGIETIEDSIDGGTELVFGTAGVGSAIHSDAVLLRDVVGANLELVAGYGGSSDLVLALEQGEIDGFCTGFDVIAESAASMLEGDSPVARIVVILGATNPVPGDPLLGGVPLWEDLAEDEEDRSILAAATAPGQIAKPFTMGPGVPADRVNALREALEATFADPGFLSEIEAAGLATSFTSGEEVTDIVSDVLALSPEVVEELNRLLAPES